MRSSVKNVKQAKELPVIRQCLELLFTSEASNKFDLSSNPRKRLPSKTKDGPESPFDLLFLNRSIKEILSDYDSNPFFKAKINCFIKSRNSVSEEIKENHNYDGAVHTFKHAKRILDREFQQKIQEICEHMRRRGHS